MSKTNAEILASLKKANKVYRERKAKEAGFPDAKAYMLHLSQNLDKIKNPTKGKVIVGEKPTIHNVHILDASGSMGGSKFRNAMIGINSEVKLLAKDDTVNYTQTIVDFSDSYDIQTNFFKVPIKEMKEYVSLTRGSTALFQAIGETLSRLLEGHNTKEKVLVKIFTDGGENASHGMYSSSRVVANLIKQCEENGFTITFVGTAGDVANIQRRLKIDDSNTLVHDNTAEGVARAYGASAGATMTYAQDVKLGKDVTKGFYKKIGKL